jgi:catechol-2,3-dioxygenase
VHHAGLYAKDPAASAEFYRDVMGMQIVGGSSPDHALGATAFLSSRPGEESHEIALFANPEFRHVAFKVASLAELRSFYRRICDRKLPVRYAFNHGASLAFYFDDPDGNLIEVYWPTGVPCVQPQVEPLDLTQSDAALLAQLSPRLAGESACPTAPAGKEDDSFFGLYSTKPQEPGKLHGG